jgi:hypothetical protein
MEEVNTYLCLYQYAGQETEGNLSMRQSFVCQATDTTEALYKYHVFLSWREKTKLYWSSLEEYRKSDYASGGWGFIAYKLDPAENYRLDDVGQFKTIYGSYRSR